MSHATRVLIVGMHYAPEPSGNAPYTTRLAQRLAERGYAVRVLTGVPHYPDWRIAPGYGAWRASSREDGVGVTRLRHLVPARPTAVKRVAMEASFGLRTSLARWRSPHVVIFVSPALISSALAIFAARLHRSRPVLGLWVQDLYSRGLVETGQGYGRVQEASLAFEGAVAKRCDGVAVVHERFKTYVTDRLGVPEERVDVLRNWTHLAPPAAGERGPVRQRLGWGDDDVVALHAGNMGVKQGLENVVAAAAEAERRGSRVRFVMVGGGNQEARLREQAQGLSRIDFVSSLDDDEFPATLAAADVLVVNERAGLREMSVPSKLTSYYTSGRPVVAATDADSVTAREIELSGAGMRVDAGDPAALVDAVEDLGGDPERAARLGAGGRRFQEEHLSETAAIDRFEEWIAKLLRSRS